MRTIAASMLFLLACSSSTHALGDERRPNILWITSEDNGPHLGCYGDTFATTPSLDRLAARGMIYRKCWSNGPVCAPARTTIISGLYPTSTGSEHMRSMVRLPAGMKMYPQFLREAGYYCTNNSKEDYNLEKPGQVWDDSSGKAHWKNRIPWQPFFAVFNILVTHESQIRARPHTPVHDPAKVRVPAYHPDTPEVRQDWAQYYDKMTEMDTIAGKHLQELTDAGLADDTIIFYYGDHGPGMPRSKRWPYDSGLHVPLIVHIPPKLRNLAPNGYQPGGKTDRLVSFVDLAPTLLSLIGVQPPEYLQGRAFMGRFEAAPNEYLHGFRGRMDERYDMVRTIRDQRYVYVRNYMPHLPYGQHVAYMFQTPTTRVWKRLFDAGKLTAAQARFWQTKPPEELYDLSNDADEVNNLADSDLPAHRAAIERLRRAHEDHAVRIRDVGFLPEAEIHTRSAGSTPYEIGHNVKKYPLERIIETAELASSLRPDSLPPLQHAFTDNDSAVRYWAAMGIVMRDKPAVQAAGDELRRALKDPSPSVRVVAAEALGRYGDDADRRQALNVLLDLACFDRTGLYVTVQALNAINRLGPMAAPGLETIKASFKGTEPIPARLKEYIPRLIEKITEDSQVPARPETGAGGDLTVWPNAVSMANSDTWLIEHHDEIRKMRPRVLVLNFCNGFSRDKAEQTAKQLIGAIAESTRYHGYTDKNAPPFIEYELFRLADLQDATPFPKTPDGNSTKYPRVPNWKSGVNFAYKELYSDAFAEHFGVKDPDNPDRFLRLHELVDRGIIHELWFFAYQREAGAPFECTEQKPVYDEDFHRVAGQHRHAGNGGDRDEPWHGRSLRINFINAQRGIGCSMESLGHAIEGTANSGVIPYFTKYFREYAGFDLDKRFGLPFSSFYGCDFQGSGSGSKGRLSFPDPHTLVGTHRGKEFRVENYVVTGGNVHFTPSSRGHYDLDNPAPVLSTIEHFRHFDSPDGTDLAEPWTVGKFRRYRHLAPDCMGPWMVYWRQNMPGLDNKSKDDSGKPMKNWWPFLFY